MPITNEQSLKLTKLLAESNSTAIDSLLQEINGSLRFEMINNIKSTIAQDVIKTLVEAIEQSNKSPANKVDIDKAIKYLHSLTNNKSFKIHLENFITKSKDPLKGLTYLTEIGTTILNNKGPTVISRPEPLALSPEQLIMARRANMHEDDDEPEVENEWDEDDDDELTQAGPVQDLPKVNFAALNSQVANEKANKDKKSADAPSTNTTRQFGNLANNTRLSENRKALAEAMKLDKERRDIANGTRTNPAVQNKEKADVPTAPPLTPSRPATPEPVPTLPPLTPASSATPIPAAVTQAKPTNNQTVRARVNAIGPELAKVLSQRGRPIEKPTEPSVPLEPTTVGNTTTQASAKPINKEIVDKAINELWSTEQNHQSVLKNLLNKFDNIKDNKTRAKLDKLLGKDIVNNIEANIRVALQASIEIENQINEHFINSKELIYTDENILQNFAKQVAPYIKASLGPVMMYSETNKYLANNPKKISELNELVKDKMPNGTVGDFSSQSIYIVQRPPRYNLLMIQIEKHLPHALKGSPYIDEAIAFINNRLKAEATVINPNAPTNTPQPGLIKRFKSWLNQSVKKLFNLTIPSELSANPSNAPVAPVLPEGPVSATQTEMSQRLSQVQSTQLELSRSGTHSISAPSSKPRNLLDSFETTKPKATEAKTITLQAQSEDVPLLKPAQMEKDDTKFTKMCNSIIETIKTESRIQPSIIREDTSVKIIGPVKAELQKHSENNYALSLSDANPENNLLASYAIFKAFKEQGKSSIVIDVNDKTLESIVKGAIKADMPIEANENTKKVLKDKGYDSLDDYIAKIDVDYQSRPKANKPM